MKLIEEVTDILDHLYVHGWDERNGGNLSYIAKEDEVAEVCPLDSDLRHFVYEDVDLSPIVGKYFVITGTGKYFKNCKKDPETNIGIMHVDDAHTLRLLWGYKDGGRPTSEAPTHLLCHIERLKKDPAHRVVMHCHPTNLIAMTHICDLDSARFTEILWKMQTESIVVFPEGVAILPWMLCGGTEIGLATAAKMEGYRSVVWAQHGLFCTGKDLDEAYGLIETIEKAAEIYMLIVGHDIKQSISNDNLKEIAAAFHLDYRKGIID
ncbi:MAG: rhamnulose-1-phosphate aldolase [Candidatus Enteromonas sp.]